jgi:hypothetical protein
VYRFMAANHRDDSDFTIVLGEYKWKVQADVMSKASRWFDAACNRGFLVSGFATATVKSVQWRY